MVTELSALHGQGQGAAQFLMLYPRDERYELYHP